VLELLKHLKEKRKQAKRQRIERKFEELYAKAEVILKRYNPCAISIVNGKISCIDCGIQSRSSFFKPAVPNFLCCKGCKFHDIIKGCTAEKPLTCKLWLCLTATCKFPKCHKALRKLRIEANDWGLYYSRGSKQDSLRKAYELANCD
jgi:hypothetical protein